MTASIRLLPSFLIIGAQKCGTTSLYSYLIQHPRIVPPSKKEVGFFGRHFDKGIRWYRANFPLYRVNPFGRAPITGEASTGYICHPHVPTQVLDALPDAKLIALLRNPVDRAYSHYRHIVWRGEEKLSFEDAMEAEHERVHDVVERMRHDERYYSPDFHLYAYLSHGIYIDQLPVWFDLFGRDRILILKSEEMFSNPSMIYRKTIDFLGLEAWEPEQYEIYRKPAIHDKMNPATRKRLVEYFKPYNRALGSYLSMDLNWDR